MKVARRAKHCPASLLFSFYTGCGQQSDDEFARDQDIVLRIETDWTNEQLKKK
jgi:hypothetical protein